MLLARWDPVLFEAQIQQLSAQAMILTMAVRRGIIPKEKLAELEAEAARYFANRKIDDAWTEFEKAEKSREKPRKS